MSGLCSSISAWNCDFLPAEFNTMTVMWPVRVCCGRASIVDSSVDVSERQLKELSVSMDSCIDVVE